jgi:hypothetical protein
MPFYLVHLKVFIHTVEVLVSTRYHQINQGRQVIQILMMMQRLAVNEEGMVGHLQKTLIFQLLQRLIQLVQNPRESKLTLNKHRPLYGNLILKKVSKKIF